MDEVEDLGHPHVRHRLVHDLLDLDRSDPPAQRRAKHDAVLAQGLTGNHRRELDHQSGPGVQIAVPEHFVEGEVVEDLDELGVGHRQGGDVAGKQLVVVLVRRVSNSNGAFGAVLLLLIAH